MTVGTAGEQGTHTEQAAFALRARGVTHEYQSIDGTSIPAVADIDLGIERGSFVSLIGPSGCGKSTLLSSWGVSCRPAAVRS